MTHFRKASKKYIQKYRADWEDKNEFRGWLKRHPNDPEKAICNVCNVVIKAHLCDLKKHGSAKKHLNATELVRELKLNKEDGSYEFRSNYQYDPEMDEEEEESDENISIRWPSDSVKCLLKHLKVYWKDLQDGLRKKKDIWEDISAAMMVDGIHNMSSEECSKKFRNMKVMYLKVLRKSVLLGDLPNYRIDYFSDLSELLSDDPEILSYLQPKKDGFKSETIDEDISDEETIVMEESEFDIATDGDGEWTETAVHLMLDFLQEFRDVFSGKEGENDDAVWQNVTEQLRLKEIEVDENQCGRKWQSLVREYNHCRAIMETEGSLPLWPYFTQVRHLINVVKIPTQGIEETERIQIQLRRDKTRGRKRKTSEHADESDGSEAEFSSPHRSTSYSKIRPDDRNTLRAMHRLTETAELWNRMNSIEMKLDDISDHHDTQRQTNSLLRQILKELSVLANHLTPQLDPLREGITIEIPNLDQHSV